MSIVYIIIGMIAVLYGADKLTDGACAIARKLNVPQIVIGLTIVAFGTSMPELSVSMVSALKGTSDLAIGNVVGSNIFNALLIVGVAALVAPITISKSTVRKDMPFGIGASLLLFFLCLDGNISRVDSLLMLAGFVVFMIYTLRLAKKGSDDEPSPDDKQYGYLRSCVYIVLGLALLIFGSDWFVQGAVDIAKSLGVSEAVIGLTIVACGTSLPELATSVVSAKKGQSAIAIGNVIGSNVFNILMILGLTGAITPMSLGGITMVDMAMMMFSMVLIWLFSFTRYKIERWEGAVLTVVFIGYLVWLVVHA